MKYTLNNSIRIWRFRYVLKALIDLYDTATETKLDLEQTITAMSDT